MSTGFDLWAAEAVLRARAALPVQLLCVVPFDGQADRFPLEWKRRFNRCLLAADKVYALSRSYHAGCFAARNRFMVDASSRLICYYDGRSGGTAQTVRLARQNGLTDRKSRGRAAFAAVKRTDRDGQSFCFAFVCVCVLCRTAGDLTPPFLSKLHRFYSAIHSIVGAHQCVRPKRTATYEKGRTHWSAPTVICSGRLHHGIAVTNCRFHPAE